MNEVKRYKKYGLPKGWEWIELSKLCEQISKVRPAEQDQESNFFYLDIGSIDNTNNKIIGHKIYKWKDAPSRAQQIVQKGDVLFSTVRTYLKNIALIDSSLYNNQIASSGFTVLRGKMNVLHPKFLFYQTTTNNFLEPLNKLQTGSSYPAVRDKDVLSQAIPVPLYDVQQQIVSKIEELFSEIDKSIEQLKTAQQQLKVYRQSVLKWAFEGKLTNEIVKDAELPNGWKLDCLGNFIESPKYGTSKKCDYNVKGTPVLRIPNIADGHIDQSDLKYAQFNEKEIQAYHLKDGDLLLIRSNGSVDLVGKCALINKLDEHFLYAGYLIRLRIKHGLVPKFLLHLFHSTNLRNQIEEKARSTSGVNNINSDEIKSLSIPIPSILEQNKIIEEIESRLSVAYKLEETIADSLQQAEALRQSILKKAFKGELLKNKHNI